MLIYTCRISYPPCIRHTHLCTPVGHIVGNEYEPRRAHLENLVMAYTRQGKGAEARRGLQLSGRLEEAAGLGIEQTVEPKGGHLGVAVVGGVDAVLNVVEGESVLALEVDEDDGAAGFLLVGDELLDLRVDLVGAGVGLGVAVDEKGGQKDGGLGASVVQNLQELFHAATGAGDVDFAYTVIGTDVDQVDVRAPLRRRTLRLLAHLVDDLARPPLVLVVLHRPFRVVAHHVHLVAVLHNRVAQVLPVPVAVAR